MPATTNTLIVEQNPSGHRFYYVRILAEAALSRGDAVTLAITRESAESAYFEVHLSHITSKLRIVHTSDFTPTGLARLSNELGAHRTVVPDGDGFAIHLAREGKWQGVGSVTALIMREASQPSRIVLWGRLKTYAKKAMLTRAAAIDRARIVVLKSSTWVGRSNFSIARDPVSLHAGPRDVRAFVEAWALDDGRYWFGVLGSISQRKNLDLIAEALAGLEGPLSFGLLIAGKCEAGVLANANASLELLTQGGARVITVDRLLAEEELDAALTAVDCVVLAHSNEGPSGLFGKAAASGTRIVAAGAKSLKIDSQGLPDISTWSPLTKEDLARSLSRARHTSRPKAHAGLSQQDFSASLL